MRPAKEKEAESIADLPVIRFKCRREGSLSDKRHRTFSLLPEGLIPYRKYDISTCLYIKELRESGMSMQGIASELTAMFYMGKEVSFSVDLVFDYLKLFEAAALKYKLYFRKTMKDRRFIPEIRQACREFYAGERFLIGKPSQGHGIRDGP